MFSSKESYNSKIARRRQCNLHMPVFLPALSYEELINRYHPLQGRMNHVAFDSAYIGHVLNALSLKGHTLMKAKSGESKELLQQLSKSKSVSRSLFVDGSVLFDNRISEKKSSSSQRYDVGQLAMLSYRYGNGDMYKGMCRITSLPDNAAATSESEGLRIVKHGHGVYRKAEGDIYIGDFEEDVMCGFGVYKYCRHTTTGDLPPTAVSLQKALRRGNLNSSKINI